MAINSSVQKQLLQRLYGQFHELGVGTSARDLSPKGQGFADGNMGTSTRFQNPAEGRFGLSWAPEEDRLFIKV